MSRVLKVLIAISLLGAMAACQPQSRHRSAADAEAKARAKAGKTDDKGKPDKPEEPVIPPSGQVTEDQAALNSKFAKSVKDFRIDVDAAESTSEGVSQAKFTAAVKLDGIPAPVQFVGTTKTEGLDLSGLTIKLAGVNGSKDEATSVCKDADCKIMETEVKFKVEGDKVATIKVSSQREGTEEVKLVDSNDPKLSLGESLEKVKAAEVVESSVAGGSNFLRVDFYSEKYETLFSIASDLTKDVATVFSKDGSPFAVLGKTATLKVAPVEIGIEFKVDGKNVTLKVPSNKLPFKSEIR